MDTSCPHQIKRHSKKYFAIALAIILHVLIIILIFFKNDSYQTNKMPITFQKTILDTKLNTVILLSKEQELLLKSPHISKLIQKPLSPSVKFKKIPIIKPNITFKKEDNTKITKQKFLKKHKFINKIKFEKTKKNVQIKQNAKQYQKNLKLVRTQINKNYNIKLQESSENFNNLNYINKLRTKIYLNTIFYIPKNLDTHSSVEYLVKLLPNGLIHSIQKNQSSNLTGFDEAVERAIKKSQPFPSNENGKIPSDFTFTYKPNS